MFTRFFRAVFLSIASCGLSASGQESIKLDNVAWKGTLHDNRSNAKRQGSGFTPLILKTHPDANLFRDDAVGLNFEHIFNGAKRQYDLSMFTPRQDECHVESVGNNRLQVHWPGAGSSWGLEARMIYEFSDEGHIDIHFNCSPTKDLHSQGYLAMMWASYMNRAIDRKIRFWGRDGERTGWVEFGLAKETQFEVGTVSSASVPNLPFENGAQTLNLVEHPSKKFVTPFYYGLLDGDHDLDTKDDRLLYMMLFDQTDSIRFAMWNFIKDASDKPDTHSPAWDWQFVIRNPKLGQQYGYRARIVVKPFSGEKQVWQEYERWTKKIESDLPQVPISVNLDRR